MRLIRVCGVVALIVLALSSCSRDPNVAKRRYLESGNKYFDRGKFKEAGMMYRDALQKDRTFGEAHYRLALAYLKMNNLQEAVRSLRRSIEFLKPTEEHRWDAIVKLSEIYVTVGGSDKTLQSEVEKYAKMLLARDPNSYDGHHLTGQLANVRANQQLRVGEKADAYKLLDEAMAEYQKADGVKPGQIAVMMEIAGVHALKGDVPAAEEMYRKVIAAKKDFVAAYSSLYQLAVQQHKLDLAEQVLKDAYHNNPRQYAFLQRLAFLYFSEDRRDDMLKTLQEIKSHANDYPNAYMDVGDFYFRQGDSESAIREYREGMTKDPKQRSNYQKHVIEVLMRQGKRAEAAQLNEQILSENANDEDAKSLAASLKLERGDVTHALAELQRVVTAAPDNFVAHFNLGRAYAAHGDAEQARQQFDRAIELRPDYVAARLALAQLQAMRGDYGAAVKAAQQCLAVDANNMGAKLVETASLMGLKRYADARVMLEALRASNPNSPDILFQLGSLDLSENKYKDAETVFRRVFELNPANVRGLVGLAETFLSQGKTDQAMALLKAESDKAPARLDLKVLIAEVSARVGRYDEAIGYYQSVAGSLDKGAKARGDVYLHMGETYRRKGDYQHAIEALRTARENLPESAAVLTTLGLSLEQAQQFGEARKAYDAALKLDPNNPVALNNLAYLEAEHGGDLNRAQSLAQRAKQFMPNRPEVDDTLGWIFLKRNLADNAIDVFSELVRTNPHSSTLLYHLGMAYNQRGDKVSAARELNRALKENPPAQEAKDIRDLLQRVQ